MTITDAIGLFGVVLYVISYAGLQLGMLAAGDLRYTALNVAGGIAVITSLVWNLNVPALVMQVLWFVFTIIGYVRARRNGRAAVPAVDALGQTEPPPGFRSGRPDAI